MANDVHAGGCSCGMVRIRIAGAPIVTHCCHCLTCQRIGGSAFAVNAMYEADRVAVSAGDPIAVATPSSHPDGKTIYRCPHCSTALWSVHPLLGPPIRLVYVGVLDDPRRIAPDIHCFTATKHPWVAVPDDVPSFPALYDEKQVYRPDQLARLQAALRGS